MSALLDNLEDDLLRSELRTVCELSPFFEQLLEREPSFPELLASADETQSESDLLARYRAFVAEGPPGDEGLPLVLRSLRRREMIRIIFRDLTRRATLVETTTELTSLAEFCVEEALSDCYESAVQRYGQPQGPDGQPEKLIILGMGKLGAGELNLSSDIDLVFLYNNQGTLQQENGQDLSFQEFFLRIARKLISYLDDAGSIDHVFRVDMRLRPYGDSGPLVLHRAAMEKYYIEQGRDWERYAFIKARPIAGDLEAGMDFLEWMKPFVFRRHLDYGAVQSLRQMKGLITKQVELKEVSHDLKLGPGGIREVEFIAQAHQLIWGGRYPELQRAELLPVLDLLAEEEFLSAEDASALKDAYTFLRNSEHAVQAEYDRQTHLLPVDEESQTRLARAMGFESYEDYLERLDAHRNFVTECFDRVISPDRIGEPADVEQEWITAWQSPADDLVAELRSEADRLGLEPEVTARLDELMPVMLKQISASSDPGLAMKGMIPVVSAILRRSTYLVFLNENRDALCQAVELAAVSVWIAEQLESYPILLYELSERALREVAVTRLELEGELREQMRVVDAGDLEMQMDILRQFKLAAMVKIAAMELLDRISIMQASDGLTALAEVILETSVDIAWTYLEGRHGRPTDEDDNPIHARLAVIAYGKAGGYELAYGSDLDLVFLCPTYIQGNTDGASSINNNVFYVRFGQRVIHILTSFTRFGILYSADLRLRPQGNKGPLVATIGAFERYQLNDAWTWEHQALIRARFVAGDRELGVQFESVRQQVITRNRDRKKLLQDVDSMRQRMRDHLASPADQLTEDGSEILGSFDLKHDAGAIVDIEFMVQYAVLAWASGHKGLVRWTDVMRLLDELETAGIFTEAEVDSLQRAYLAFRASVHHGWLGLETDYERLQGYRQEVHHIWLDHMES